MDIDNVNLSPEALNSCGVLSAIAGQTWDEISDDAELFVGHEPATAESLGKVTRWGERIHSVLSELETVGFISVREGRYFVRNFGRWQARPSGGAREQAKKRPEVRSKKSEVRSKKQSARFAREGARAWERLVEVRKELIPGSRYGKPCDDAKRAIANRIEESSPDDALAVIEHCAGEVRRGSDAKWLNWVTIFRKSNYHRKLGMIGATESNVTTLHSRREDHAAEAGEVAL